MATKKPVPLVKKSKAATPKVFDVARPNQSVASSTSKSVLISNRPVIQDPMVNEDRRDDLEPIKIEQAPSAKKLVIQPLHTDIVPEAATPVKVTVNSPEAADEPDASLNDTAVEEATLEPETTPEPETIAFSKTVSGVPTQNPSAPDNQLKPAGAPTKPLPGLEPIKIVDPMLAPGTPIPTTDKQVSPGQSDDIALLAAQKRAAELQHIIDRQQYFLPIKTIEERRSRRIAIIGLVLIIVLGAAWYDTALDAGLINNTYNLPHTHLFVAK